jgi:hypothetical protein
MVLTLVSCQVNRDSINNKAHKELTFVIPFLQLRSGQDLILNPDGVERLDSRLRGNDNSFN